MIKVTRLNSTEFVVNAHMIELIEKTPDTVLTLISGKKYIVQDSVEDIIKKIIQYRNNIKTEIGQESYFSKSDDLGN